MGLFSKKHNCIVCNSSSGKFNIGKGFLCGNCIKKIPKDMRCRLSQYSSAEIIDFLSRCENAYVCTICGKEAKFKLNKLKCLNKDGYICTSCGMKALNINLKKSTIEEIKNEVNKRKNANSFNNQLSKKDDIILPSSIPNEWEGGELIDCYECVFVTGSLHNYGDENTQNNLIDTKINERVYLIREGSKKFPNAVRVVNSTENHLGWIPEDDSNEFQQSEIANFLDKETSYLCIISEIEEFEKADNFYIGITVDIGFYK